MSNFSVVVFLGKWRARPFHSVSSDLPAHSRPHTRRSVGHGWSPTIFPCGSRANTAGEKLIQTHIYTHTRDKDGTDTEELCSPDSPSRDKYSLSGANDPWRYYSPVKAEYVIQAVQQESCFVLHPHRSPIFFTTKKTSQPLLFFWT